jgi:hypothetical protein
VIKNEVEIFFRFSGEKERIDRFSVTYILSSQLVKPFERQGKER